MKKITLALAAFVLSTSAAANSADDIKFCTEISTLSTTIMTDRQSGKSLAEMLSLAHKPEFNGMQELLMLIVQSAYKAPRFSTDKVKKETITEFANTMMLQCLTELKG